MAKFKGKYFYLGDPEPDTPVLKTTGHPIKSARIVKRRNGDTIITVEETDGGGDWKWELESSNGIRFKGHITEKGESDGFPCEVDLWKSTRVGDREYLLLGFFREPGRGVRNIAVSLVGD